MLSTETEKLAYTTPFHMHLEAWHLNFWGKKLENSFKSKKNVGRLHKDAAPPHVPSFLKMGSSYSRGNGLAPGQQSRTTSLLKCGSP